MLTIARANLDHICCICFMDIRPPMFTQKVSDLRNDNEIFRMLKLTALLTILKNPINQNYINDYCRKMCEICFAKVQYSYLLRERIIASTAALKEILENDDLKDQDIERLQFFCRICLNRQKAIKNINILKMIHLNWLKNCSGIRFTTLIDTETFRIKEGTNINEIAVINDEHFPKQLCLKCFKKLENVEEFRQSATRAFEYMVSVMGEASGQEVKLIKDHIIFGKVDQTQPTFVTIADTKQESSIFDENGHMEYQSNVEENIDASTNSSLEDGTIYVLEIMDDLSHYSDNDEDFSDFNKCLGITGAPNMKQSNVNVEKELKIEEEEITVNTLEPKLRRRSEKQLDELYKPFKCTRSAKKLKIAETSPSENMQNNGVNSSKERFVCNDCCQDFESKSKYKNHRRAVHWKQTIHECPMCSKKFKNKSHLTIHIKNVHEQLRPFKCLHCSDTFSSNSSRRVHELTHTGDYPFVCKWCGKGFRRSSLLKIHSEMHTENPELLCHICKRIQKSQSDLEDHLKSHNDKRSLCTLCGKLFTRSCHLKDHYNAVHLKLRPFKCAFCELAFGDRKTQKSHEKRHTEDRPITCDVCKSGFKSKFALSRHINKFGHKTDNNESINKAPKKNSARQSLNSKFVEKFHSVFEL